LDSAATFLDWPGLLGSTTLPRLSDGLGSCDPEFKDTPLPLKALNPESLLVEAGCATESFCASDLYIKDGRISPPIEASTVAKSDLSLKYLNGNFPSKCFAVAMPSLMMSRYYHEYR